MHVISTFEHSAYLELAINQLQQSGIKKESIVAVPLEITAEQPKLFDTIHRADGYSLFDLAAVIGTVFSVLGASFGFALEWGPIIWALIGMVFGLVVGFIIDYIYSKKHIHNRKLKSMNTEVVLIVKCVETEYQSIKEILAEHKAIGIGKLIT
jgi:hypothetical protein